MDASQAEEQVLLDFYVIGQFEVVNLCQYDVSIGKEQNWSGDPMVLSGNNRDIRGLILPPRWGNWRSQMG